MNFNSRCGAGLDTRNEFELQTTESRPSTDETMD